MERKVEQVSTAVSKTDGSERIGAQVLCAPYLWPGCRVKWRGQPATEWLACGTVERDHPDDPAFIIVSWDPTYAYPEGVTLKVKRVQLVAISGPLEALAQI